MGKTVEVGDWDSPGQILEVGDNATVGQVLAQIGRSLSNTERIARMDTNEIVGLNDLASDGDSFIILQNHVSG